MSKLVFFLAFLSLLPLQASAQQVQYTGSSYVTVITGGNSATSQAATINIYCGIGTVNACSGTSTNRDGIAPKSGRLRNLYLDTNGVAPTAGHNYTAAVRVNGSDTALTCTIADAATTCNDTTNSVAITAGQPVNLHITSDAAAATATAGFRWGMEYVVP